MPPLTSHASRPSTCMFFFFQAEDGIRYLYVTGVQTCALPISVLAAGSIGSPQILQLSGIGPATLLREHGIAVAHELKRSEERRVGKEGRSGRSSWSEGRKTEWRGVSEGAGWAHSEGGVRWGRW